MVHLNAAEFPYFLPKGVFLNQQKIMQCETDLLIFKKMTAKKYSLLANHCFTQKLFKPW